MRRLSTQRSSAPQYNFTPEEREGLLSSLGSSVLNGLENAGLFLDTPGALIRGVLAGDPTSGLYWDSDRRTSGSELLKSYGLEAPKEIAGSPFLGSTAKFTTGLATEIVTDPLWLLNFGASAGGRAAKVLGKTQYADDARKIATRKFIEAPLQKAREAGTFLGKENAGALEQEFAKNLAQQTPFGRSLVAKFDKDNIPFTSIMREAAPPIGVRRARYDTTLEDFINFADDKLKARADLGLAAEGLGYNLDDLLTEPIGAFASFDAGPLRKLGLPKDPIAFRPSFGGAAADAMDYLGGKVRYSAPVAAGSRLFQKAVGGADTLQGQLNNIYRSTLEETELSGMRELISEHESIALKAKKALDGNDAAKQIIGGDLDSSAGNDFLVRLSEGVLSAKEEPVLGLVPELDEWKASWADIRDTLLKAQKDLGIDVSDYTDPFGVEFLPRYADEADFGPITRGPKSLSRLNAADQASNMGRKVFTPGGQMDLRELSETKEIRDFAEGVGRGAGRTEEEMLLFLKGWFAKKHGGLVPVGRKKPPPGQLANKYRFVSKFDENGERLYFTRKNLKDVLGLLEKYDPQYFRTTPGQERRLFSASPVVTQSRYMTNTAKGLANARYFYDVIADTAIPTPRNEIPGGGYKNLQYVLDDLTAKLGFARKAIEDAEGNVIGSTFADEVREQLSSRLYKTVAQEVPGATPEGIDFKNFSVPDSVVAELQKRVSDLVPKAKQNEIARALTSFTSLFKNTVLARPARFVRDLYSNFLSAYFESGDAKKTMKGFWYARKLMRGDTADVVEYLRTLPPYRKMGGLSDEAIVDAFAKDLSRNGLLQGLASSDLLRADSSIGLSQYYPGAESKTIAGALSNLQRLLPSEDRTLKDIAREFGTIRGVGIANPPTRTLNPIFQASEEIGDIVDSWARLAGYMALLDNAVTPELAAKRIKKSMVDYSTLTDFERDNFTSAWLPFWSYNSRIGAWAAETLFNNPGGRYSQFIRGVTNVPEDFNEGSYVPSSIREGIGLRLPGGDDTGVTRYLTGFDFPGGDILSQYKTQRNSLLPDVSATAESLLMMANPLVKAGAELAFQKDLFTNRPLSDADTTANRLYKKFAGPGANLSGPAKVALANFPPLMFFDPITRPLTDERLPMGKRLSKFATNYLMGVKVQDTDLEFEAADQSRMIAPLVERLQRTMERRWTPKDALATATPEELLFLRLAEDVEQNRKRGRALREAREGKR